MPENIAAVERRIEEALKSVSALEFGQRIKASRNQQGITVRDLAERANLSKTSIVNLEKGISCRAVTVMKVCGALGLHIERFLGSSPIQPLDIAVHRHTDDRWYDLTGFSSGPLGGLERPLSGVELEDFHRQGIGAQMLMFKSRFTDSNFWAGIIELTQKSEPRQHPGEEFVFVLNGSLIVEVGNTLTNLVAGESICFNPNLVHSYGPGGNDHKKVSFLCFRVNMPGT